MDKGKLQKGFNEQIVDKINYVRTKKCWAVNISSNINNKLKAAKKLDLYKGELLDEETIEQLQALHELNFFEEMKKIILEKTELGHLFESESPSPDITE